MYCILGKDARYDILAEKLGKTAKVTRSPCGDGVYILPMTAPDDDFLPILETLGEKSRVLFGRASEKQRALCESRRIKYLELLKDEKYLYSNSVATAEGTVAEVIKNTPRVLSGESVLVCGYGHCGRKIAQLLWLLGCEVFVYSHKNSLKRAIADGFNAFPADSPRIAMFGIIVNTVPSGFMTEESVSRIREGCAFFQVATGTSGFDPEKMRQRGILWYGLPGLPAKYSPESEAEEISAALTKLIT